MRKRKLKIDISDQMITTVVSFEGSKFNTADFIKRFESLFPNEWNKILEAYSAGGKGSGKPYTSNNFIGRQLFELSDDKIIDYLEVVRSPDHWGSPVIGVWKEKKIHNETSLFPEEIPLGLSFHEGTRLRININRYERDRRARDICIAIHGTSCKSCGIIFEKLYGHIGKGFIHVHHLKPLSDVGASYNVNPRTDLVPVCPNCHAMLHRTNPPLSISRLQAVMRSAKRKNST